VVLLVVVKDDDDDGGIIFVDVMVFVDTVGCCF